MPNIPNERLHPNYLELAALDRPRLAYALAFRESTRVADHVIDALRASLETVNRESDASERARQSEEAVNALSHEIVKYLAQLGERMPRAPVHALLSICTSLEAIGDLSKRLLRQHEKLQDRGLEFSLEGQLEVRSIGTRALERMRLALTAFSVGDTNTTERLRQDGLVLESIMLSRQAHLMRLSIGQEESELTSRVHLNVLTILEQINAEVTNIVTQATHLETRVADTHTWAA
jgi:phosphate:Na+ symporter